MPNIRIKTCTCALAVLLGMCIVMAVASPTTTNQEIVGMELRVPGVLVQALLREYKIREPIEIRIPETLPMVLSTEDWQQIPKRRQ